MDGTLYPNSLMYLASVPFVLTRPRLMLAFRSVRRELRSVRPIDDLYRRQAEMLAAELGIDTAVAADRIRRRIYPGAERVLSVVPRFPGVRATVEAFRHAGIRVGLLSDFPIGRKLERLGLTDLFDVQVEAEAVGYLKPNPEPFERLLAELGTPAAETLYVGNNHAYDVVGARAVGMHTAHLTLSPAPDDPADVCFFSYRKLTRWVLDGQIGPENSN